MIHRAATRRSGLALLSLALCLPPARKSAATDWERATAEAVDLLRGYLRLDTTNPPGNERRAADLLNGLFEREGIESEVLDMGGGHANVIARLPGRGAKRPLLLLHHMDVVPADAERWAVPPFSGELKDGFVWGRGATDMKGTAVCHVMTLLLLKRSGARLDRDVILLGTSDEEDGTVANGVDWLLAHHPEKLRGAEAALTEGATISVRDGKTEAWNVDVTEKSVLWLKVTARGKAGHASIPEPGGAVPRLLRALRRILDYEPPPRVIPAVKRYFGELARTAPPPLRNDLAHPTTALRDPVRRMRLLSEPSRNAHLRATISITGLAGSPKVNVIPGEASATLDCRLLPGDDPAAFLRTLQQVAGDRELEWTVLQQTKATESPVDTELFRAILRARDAFEPGVPVLTPPLTSTTDATKLREIGMVVYGFEPFRLAEDEDRSHGDDERVSVANVEFALKVTHALVSDVCGARAGD